MASDSDRPGSAYSTIRQRLGRLTDPVVLFPIIGAILLLVIWSATSSLIDSTFDNARRGAATSAVDIAQTYEAQVVRALREIDQTLKFIKYAHEAGGETALLDELRARDLLPSDLLFVVSITDARGHIIAGTREAETQEVAGQSFFEIQRETDTLAIGAPQQNPSSGEWSMPFSRRLDTPDGSFAGIVMVSVDPVYFVSSYEPRTMGSRGIMGILGADNIIRALRTGDDISYAERVDYANILEAGSAPGNEARLLLNEWDGQHRYTVVHELFGFPLAVMVGLSEREQLAVAREERTSYLWRAAIASILLLLVIAVLGRLSWQLQRSRLSFIEEQMAHAKQIEYLAYHDNLTGLPNRSLFSKLLNQSIREAQRYDRQLSLLFLDMDGFKFINDTLGHEAGDELLKEIGSRLKTALRESDTVARLGGDEFVVILPEMSDKASVSTVARKILNSIRQPFNLSGQEFHISASLGISRFPRDGVDEQTLVKNADTAMYNAKEEGKNGFRFYSHKLNSDSLERRTLESNLRHAVEHGEFRLVYQARQNTRSKHVTGVEALLRWHHPELGPIPPKQFLPLAEETGLIIPIGRWVLETACKQSVAWREQGIAPINMAVNLSSREFSDTNLIRSIAGIVEKTGMDPRLLEIEVTERMLMQDLEATVRTIKELKALGVHISIDNFGAGYSSLSTLEQFQLDTIKVDGAFIRDIAGNIEDSILMEGIISIARGLGLTVVAEGVETKSQVDYLNERSCDELQGFYFGKPVAAEEITELLKSESLAASVDQPTTESSVQP